MWLSKVEKMNYGVRIIISCECGIPETCREVPLSSTIPLTSLKMTLWPVWRPCGWLSMQVTTPGLPCKDKTETVQTFVWTSVLKKKPNKTKLSTKNIKVKLNPNFNFFFLFFCWRGFDYLSDRLDENLLGLLSSGVWHLKLLSKVTEDSNTDAVSICADELA